MTIYQISILLLTFAIVLIQYAKDHIKDTLKKWINGISAVLGVAIIGFSFIESDNSAKKETYLNNNIQQLIEGNRNLVIKNDSLLQIIYGSYNSDRKDFSSVFNNFKITSVQLQNSANKLDKANSNINTTLNKANELQQPILPLGIQLSFEISPKEKSKNYDRLQQCSRAIINKYRKSFPLNNGGGYFTKLQGTCFTLVGDDYDFLNNNEFIDLVESVEKFNPAFAILYIIGDSENNTSHTDTANYDYKVILPLSFITSETICKRFSTYDYILDCSFYYSHYYSNPLIIFGTKKIKSITSLHKKGKIVLKLDNRLNNGTSNLYKIGFYTHDRNDIYHNVDFRNNSNVISYYYSDYSYFVINSCNF